MLEFTNGWTWFLAGLAATIAVTFVNFGAVAALRISERRHTGQRGR